MFHVKTSAYFIITTLYENSNITSDNEVKCNFCLGSHYWKPGEAIFFYIIVITESSKNNLRTKFTS